MNLLDSKNIINLLEKHKVKSGDNLFIHGNAIVIAQMKGGSLEEKIYKFWNTIIEFLGPKGTIIVPTFTYSPMKSEIFDYRFSESSVGQFSEQFRNLPKVQRTLHPIFSVAYRGILSECIKELSLNTCFGEQSIFELLLTKKFRIFCFGCSFNAVTFIHFIEENLQVKYRYYKYFASKYFQNNQIKTVEVKYYVRDLKMKISTKPNLEKLKRKLIHNKTFENFTLFLNSVYSVNASDMFDTSLALYKDDPFFLIN